MSFLAQGEWKFDFTSEADKDLQKLDSSVRRRVLERLRWFREHFQEASLLPLVSDWKGFFKFRVGDWRVVYEIERGKRRVIFHRIERRDKVYKKRKPR